MLFVVVLFLFTNKFIINNLQVREETSEVVINCLDITVKSASFSVGELSEYNAPN